MHFYAWKKGLKTGCYYLRTRPAADAIQFTVDQQTVAQAKGKPTPAPLDVEVADKENATPNASAGGGKGAEAEVKIPLSPLAQDQAAMLAAAKLACSRANPEACEMCSS
mmetsp:Transcript_53830/g.107966  ORF Transcript_53830/g.107966 Transcript_53830/m.107966 type:complete len:109 (+) Transcript_53830:1-327(+)